MNLILTVGNSMMGDDGAGPMLAELMTNAPIAGWHVLDGGSAPENVSHEVESISPRRVVVFDAADMGLAPGEIRLIDDRCIADLFIMTTHNLPLSFLIERLREIVPEVIFLGVQPDIVAFHFPMSDSVKNAVHLIYADLVRGNDPAQYAWL